MKPSIDSEKHRLLIIRIENEMILLFACCIQGKGKAYKKIVAGTIFKRINIALLDRKSNF